MIPNKDTILNFDTSFIRHNGYIIKFPIKKGKMYL